MTSSATRARSMVLLFLVGTLSAACDTSTGTGGAGGGTTSTSSVTTASTSSTSTGATTSGTATGTGSSTSSGMGGPPTAAELLALTATCDVASASKYATDEGEANTVDVCALSGAFFWTSDFDVDCDGKMTIQCKPSTDAAYQPETSATDSQGDPLDAAGLPYFVIPLPSAKWDFGAAGIQLGDVGAVVYNGKVVYAVFGDEGPNGIIGEGSYALAEALGIDPDPSTGGSDGPVTFIVFPGANAVVSPIEDHQAATALGEALATKLLQDNP